MMDDGPSRPPVGPRPARPPLVGVPTSRTFPPTPGPIRPVDATNPIAGRSTTPRRAPPPEAETPERTRHRPSPRPDETKPIRPARVRARATERSQFPRRETNPTGYWGG